MFVFVFEAGGGASLFVVWFRLCLLVFLCLRVFFLGGGVLMFLGCRV